MEVKHRGRPIYGQDKMGPSRLEETSLTAKGQSVSREEQRRSSGGHRDMTGQGPGMRARFEVVLDPAPYSPC